MGHFLSKLIKSNRQAAVDKENQSGKQHLSKLLHGLSKVAILTVNLAPLHPEVDNAAPFITVMG